MADNDQIKPDKKTLPSDEDKNSEPVDRQVNNPVAQPDQQTSELENNDAPVVSETSIAEATPVESAEDAAAVFEGEGTEVTIPEPEVKAQQVSEPAEASESVDQPSSQSDTVDQDIIEEVADSDKSELSEKSEGEVSDHSEPSDNSDNSDSPITPVNDNPNAKWYVVHTFSGHENKVATNLKQRIDSEHLENRIIDILVPTQDKIEIRGGKKEQVKEKIFPGYILVKMDLDDASWLAVRTTQGVTAFVGMNNKPTPISEREVQSIVKFMTQGAPATFKDVFMVDDTVKIIDGPFTDFIGKVESVDKEKGKVRVLVSIFGRETPVELDFLQVTKL